MMETRTLPSRLKKSLKAARKSVRNYEVIACVHVGKTVTVAIAVVEEGHATYAVGALTWAEFRHHFSKIDQVIGTWQREYEQLRTLSMMEEMQKSGIDIAEEPVRYYEPLSSLKWPRRTETVINTLLPYLKKKGFSYESAKTPLHVRHLERMRHRTGFIIPSQKADDGYTTT